MWKPIQRLICRMTARVDSCLVAEGDGRTRAAETDTVGNLPPAGGRQWHVARHVAGLAELLSRNVRSRRATSRCSSRCSQMITAAVLLAELVPIFSAQDDVHWSSVLPAAWRFCRAPGTNAMRCGPSPSNFCAVCTSTDEKGYNPLCSCGRRSARGGQARSS